MKKNGIGRDVLIVSVLMMTILAVQSVIGAFAGAARSKVFFNSVPLTVFWVLLFLTLASGFFFWPNLRRRTGSLLMHAGLMLVLAGGLAGSERGHELLNRFYRQPRIPRGVIVLREGEIGNKALLDDGRPFKLPFDLHLKRAAVEYYPQTAMASDYKSDLELIDNGVTVKAAQIEVNKPLYYGGYHFYQNTFGMEGEIPVSGILIVSARGIVLVFAGYAFIAAGLCMHFGRICFSRPVLWEPAA